MTVRKPDPELRRELVFQLIETSRLLHAYVDLIARANGTTRAQWSVLGRLRRQEGLSQSELARELELAPISLVPLLDRLVAQNYVERRADPKDRRANRLHLTDAGRRFLSDLDPVGHDIRAQILEGQPDEKLRIVCDLLVEMKERLKTATRRSHESDSETADGAAAERTTSRETTR